MFIQNPKTVGGLVVLTDYRSLSDAQFDDAHREDHPGSLNEHVLDFYTLGRKASTYRVWDYTTRIALFEYDAKPDGDARNKARVELARYLQQTKPRLVAVIPNETGGENSRGQTICWQQFGAPDKADNMRGTFYEYEPGCFVMPLHSMSPWQKELTRWQQARWIKRAHDFAQDRTDLLTCRHKLCIPNVDALDALCHMRGKSIAIDIESIESSGLITAIGVSDGVYAVSVPWDRFTPHGRQEPEPGLDNYPYRTRILDTLNSLFLADTQKYFHNFTFDVPRLEAEGFEINGPIHDTFAAHAIAFPELRHGLQHACADMLDVRPWKSVWHPKLKGVTRQDEEFWSCDPDALRDYNCDDAFHTWHLAQQVLPCIGVGDV